MFNFYISRIEAGAIIGIWW